MKLDVEDFCGTYSSKQEFRENRTSENHKHELREYRVSDGRKHEFRENPVIDGRKHQLREKRVIDSHKNEFRENRVRVGLTHELRENRHSENRIGAVVLYLPFYREAIRNEVERLANVCELRHAVRRCVFVHQSLPITGICAFLVAHTATLQTETKFPSTCHRIMVQKFQSLPVNHPSCQTECEMSMNVFCGA
jgi:hypothetical protein